MDTTLLFGDMNLGYWSVVDCVAVYMFNKGALVILICISSFEYEGLFYFLMRFS